MRSCEAENRKFKLEDFLEAQYGALRIWTYQADDRCLSQVLDDVRGVLRNESGWFEFEFLKNLQERVSRMEHYNNKNFVVLSA